VCCVITLKSNVQCSCPLHEEDSWGVNPYILNLGLEKFYRKLNTQLINGSDESVLLSRLIFPSTNVK